MPIYTEPDEPPFAALETRDGWFGAVMLADYGEWDAAPPDADVPDALNWLLLVPPDRRYDFDEAECSLAYVAADGGYRCTIWDVTGEDDDPWAVFLVDLQGARLLPECSLAYVAADGGYRCTVWDVTGEDDDPWAVFLVDLQGTRLLPEYSVFDEDADEETREDALRRAAVEIPERLERGEFARTGDPLPVPDWLRAAP